ncbi:MAG: hypothetical protein ACRCXD_00185 [Luteolibacter sp.]
MPDPPSRLIEAAVRPLSDNAELQQAAIGLLETRIAEDAGADAMIARWDQVDAQKRKSIWQIGLWVLVAVVSAGVAASDFDEMSRIVPLGKWIANGSFLNPMPTDELQRVTRKLSESEKLLLVGDLTRGSKSERKEALWRSEPDNPAFFAEYAGAFVADHEKLPPDFLKTARSIDPDNAWFTYMAATVEAMDSVKSKSRSGKNPKSWEILDQARLDRAMELLREARNQSEYTDYSMELLRKRLPLLPQENFIDHLESVACLSETAVFPGIRLRHLGNAIAARAWSLGASGDVTGYREIHSDADRFLRQMNHEKHTTLVYGLVGRVIASTLAESLGSAAEELGLEPEAARWKFIEGRLKDRQAKRQSREFLVDGKAVEQDTITGGILAGAVEMIAKQTATQVPLTAADLKPQRLFDHEFLARLLSYTTWVLLGFCASLAACYRFRVSVVFRRLARRMEDLLRPSDWVWIVVAGVVLPFVFVMAVNRLTQLGGRAFGVQGMGLLLPAGHFFGLLLLWLTLPVQIVRWRLAKRAGAFSFPKPSRIGWLTGVSAILFVPMMGWAAVSQVGDSWWSVGTLPERPWQFWLAVGLGGVALLGVMVSISIAMLGRADRHFYQASSALVMVKVFAVAMLVIALASVGFKASERYWFKQDWMTKFDVAGPGWSAFESKVATQMRKELRETLGND